MATSISSGEGRAAAQVAREEAELEGGLAEPKARWVRGMRRVSALVRLADAILLNCYASPRCFQKSRARSWMSGFKIDSPPFPKRTSAASAITIRHTRLRSISIELHPSSLVVRVQQRDHLGPDVFSLPPFSFLLVQLVDDTYQSFRILHLVPRLDTSVQHGTIDRFALDVF